MAKASEITTQALSRCWISTCENLMRKGCIADAKGATFKLVAVEKFIY
ncbi:hypothetical protein HYU16_02710 [Candidatus Woesearchaeota archaeon]|nr:hypothetical protein [Candidatus Woesearchaeota archaeon]